MCGPENRGVAALTIGVVRVNLAHCLGGTNSGFSTRQSDDPEAHELAQQVAEEDLAAMQDLGVGYIPGW